MSFSALKLNPVWTIPNGANPAESEWIRAIPAGYQQKITRLLGLTTNEHCPAATLTCSVRDPENDAVKVVQNFSLTVGPDQAFGASDMAAISSLVDGMELRWTLSTPPTTGDCIITMRIT